MGFRDLFTRAAPDRLPAVVASAKRMNLSERNKPVTVRGWQRRAFALYGQVGEVHSAFNLFANGLSRVTAFPAWRGWDDRDPIPLREALELDDPDAVKPPPDLVAQAQEMWWRLEDTDGGLQNQGGVAGLISEAALHLSLVGEGTLYVPVDQKRPVEFLSISELSQRQGRWEIRRSESKRDGEPVDPDDLALRVWRPDPQWSDDPSSSLQPVLDTGDFLRLAEKGDLAIARSRLANSGIVAIDKNVTVVRNAGRPGEQNLPSKFSTELVEAGIAAIQDPSSAAAVMPIVVEIDPGSGKISEQIIHVPVTRPLDSEMRSRVEQALRRLAMSVDLPPELMLGKENLNHWTAWQVDESTFKAHLEPTLLLVEAAIAGGWLRTGLMFDPATLRRLTCWHDATDLLIRPDRTQDARWAHDSLLISDEAALREIGFDPADIPDETEIERRLTYKAAIIIANKTGQIPDIGAMLAGDRQTGNDTGTQGAPDTQADEPDPDAVVAALRARVEDARRRALVASAQRDGRLRGLAATLDGIDADLYARLEGAVEQTMQRVLDRAGARLRSKARRDNSVTAALDDVHNGHVAATLGPKIVRSLVAAGERELVEDGFDELHDRFDGWTAAAQGAALAAVLAYRADGVDVDEVEHEQARDRDDAWRWLRDALIGAALGLLFSPDRVDDEPGELGDVRVPFEIVREAVGRAGGAASNLGTVASRVKDIGVLARSRGVATGVRIANVLQVLGVQERGLLWVYGQAPRRTFEPHLSLDGQTFTGPEDDALTVGGTFPRTSHYYPGDHRGCRCRWAQVLVDTTAEPTPSPN